MTEKELMRKTKQELVEIILEQREVLAETEAEAQTAAPKQEAQTTCADCANWNETGKYCRYLTRKTKAGSYCGWAVKK